MLGQLSNIFVFGILLFLLVVLPLSTVTLGLNSFFVIRISLLGKDDWPNILLIIAFTKSLLLGDPRIFLSLLVVSARLMSMEKYFAFSKSNIVCDNDSSDLAVPVSYK